MTDILKKHRVIGIRHTLRHLKDAGFVEEETQYPEDAVSDVKDEILYTAQYWYKVGARRGALEFIEALLDGKFDIETKSDGSRWVTANEETINWKKGLRVRVGNEHKRIKMRNYKLTIKSLGFE